MQIRNVIFQFANKLNKVFKVKPDPWFSIRYLTRTTGIKLHARQYPPPKKFINHQIINSMRYMPLNQSLHSPSKYHK